MSSESKLSQHTVEPPQGDRVFYKPTGWFFATREGLDMGPFPSRRSAENEISCYLRSMRKLYRAS